ncbi:MAG TPA: hypothetical protein VGN32_11650 [Ktedonobacterales bacterium]|jgi:hypothetical protein|nr:hypothetical protein [Ktedonobacterales bacterium]
MLDVILRTNANFLAGDSARMPAIWMRSISGDVSRDWVRIRESPPAFGLK